MTKGNILRKIQAVDSSSPLRLIWEIVVVIAILGSAIAIPYALIFGTQVLSVFYWATTCLFFADIIVNLNTRVRARNSLISNRSEIATHYIKTWFFVDLLAALPLALLPSAFLFLPLIRVIKLVKVNVTLSHIHEALPINPSIVRLAFFIFWLVLATHFIALGWILIGAGEVEGSSFHRYLLALYWTITTIATVGYGDITPDKANHVQVVYTMCVQLLGVGIFGFVIGNISSLITHMDAAKANFRKRMDDIHTFFRIRRVPLELQKRVRDYYSYLWETRKSAERDSVIDSLPISLRREILLFLNAPIIRRVALFKDLSEAFVAELSQHLEPLVFLPGDFIIRQGETGDCMYFLASGEAEVFVDDAKVNQLTSGSAFGEAALAENAKRNASVRALSYCDVYILTKKEFDALREKYESFDDHIKEIIAERLKDRLSKTASSVR